MSLEGALHFVVDVSSRGTEHYSDDCTCFPSSYCCDIALSPPCIAERHDSASGSCIELDLGNCIEIGQITWMTSWKALVSNSIIYLEIVTIQSMYIEIMRLFDINDISGDWFDTLQDLDRSGSDWNSSKSIQELPGITDNASVTLDCCVQSYRQCLFLWSHEGTDYIDRLRPQLISVRLICDGTVLALVHDHVSLWERSNDSLSVGQSLRQAIRTLLVRIVCLSRRQPLRLSEQLPRLMSLNIDCTYVAKTFSVVTSLSSDDCDNLRLLAWSDHCDEIYDLVDDCLNIVQVLGLRHLESSAELDCDCNFETLSPLRSGLS